MTAGIRRLPSRAAAPVLALLAAVGLVFMPQVRAAESVTSAQERAAAEYLAAVAAGDAQGMAFAIHPAELDRLRIVVVQRLREEAGRGESAMRVRLFGDAMPLAEIERQTSVNLFRALARRLIVRSRVYEKLDGLTAVRDGNQLHLLLKGRPPRDRGRVEVIELVTLVPYGKEWKAAIAPELEAQIDDLLNGRSRPAGLTAGSSMGGSGGAGGAGGGSAGESGGGTRSGSGSASGTSPGAAPAVTGRNTPDILALIEQAEKALVDGKCDRYYREYLSPQLRRTLSSRTLDTLVGSCNRSMASRELLIAALRIVRRTPPAFESGGNRALYDVAGQGLPYDRYVLERVEGRWYIAE
ncbi:MAG: hypothetical protein KJS95_07415 [Gammaproteobacteria bacterium]|nr:hypothetical protein [Gammaproteobacteria bacterium]